MKIKCKDKKKDAVKVVPGFEPGLPESLREVKIWSDNHYLHWRLDRLHEIRAVRRHTLHNRVSGV